MKSHSIKKIIFGLISTLMIGVVLFKIESTKIEDNETSAASSRLSSKNYMGEADKPDQPIIETILSYTMWGPPPSALIIGRCAIRKLHRTYGP